MDGSELQNITRKMGKINGHAGVVLLTEVGCKAGVTHDFCTFIMHCKSLEVLWYGGLSQ